jgi:toxin ParE1/3/4
MANVNCTPLAEQDLTDIARYLVEKSQSLAVAYRFLDSFEARCAQYSAQPELAEKCSDLGPDVRRFAIGNYVVFYRPTRGGIEILRVLHGSRDIPTAFRERPN